MYTTLINVFFYLKMIHVIILKENVSIGLKKNQLYKERFYM